MMKLKEFGTFVDETGAVWFPSLEESE